jgi:hypothetical protein
MNDRESWPRRLIESRAQESVVIRLYQFIRP